MAFQIIKHTLECQAVEPNNVFSTDPSGPGARDNAKHLRPEVAVICLASPLPGGTEGLTRESSREQVDFVMVFSFHIVNVRDNGRQGPVLAQYLLCKWIDLTEGGHLMATPDHGRGQRKPTDTREQVEVINLFQNSLHAITVR
ncbi:MAG: hypothetical protein QNK37_08250 [Acidobacteriota bacterium]|nr:hypothetical protein [Acidobacteriota bacterium]